MAGKVQKRPVVLSRKCEEILRAVHFYRYMTALDVAHLLYSPAAIRKAREDLAALCGGEDFLGNRFLYRFRMPKIESGNPERIYTLGSLGRDFLSREHGVSFGRSVRSASGTHLSFSQVIHNLILTRVLVAAHKWAADSADLRLSEVKICYELSESRPAVGTGGKVKQEKVSVIPDAWLLFERFKRGKVVEQLPVLLEIDRGTMYRQRFKRHVLSRVEFVRSGDYTRAFGVEAVVIAYATTGERGEFNEGRRKSLCSWTIEALRETERESWAEVFRFCSVGLGNIYEAPLFDESIWYRPDSEEALTLLGE